MAALTGIRKPTGAVEPGKASIHAHAQVHAHVNPHSSPLLPHFYRMRQTVGSPGRRAASPAIWGKKAEHPGPITGSAGVHTTPRRWGVHPGAPTSAGICFPAPNATTRPHSNSPALCGQHRGGSPQTGRPGSEESPCPGACKAGT